MHAIEKKFIYHNLIERQLINHANAIHYTTTLEVKESSWLNLRTDYFVVPNPVQLDEFAQLPPRGFFRKKLKISDSDQIILYLGRIEHRKGIDLTLEAFAHTAKQTSNIKLIIAGPDKNQYRCL